LPKLNVPMALNAEVEAGEPGKAADVNVSDACAEPAMAARANAPIAIEVFMLSLSLSVAFQRPCLTCSVVPRSHIRERAVTENGSLPQPPAEALLRNYKKIACIEDGQSSRCIRGRLARPACCVRPPLNVRLASRCAPNSSLDHIDSQWNWPSWPLARLAMPRPNGRLRN